MDQQGVGMSREVTISKFLSYVLRHRPEEIGLVLDSAGWARIDELLAQCAKHGRNISRDELQAVIENNDKKRYELSADGERIRASQGHSITVDLGYVPRHPPALLFHGTALRFLPSIREKGLIRGGRHHVHLSGDETTARAVGQRHGRAVVLTIRAGAMADAGWSFFQSTNGVWLTEAVPYDFIEEPAPSG